MNNSVKYGLMYGLLPAVVMLIIYGLGMNRDMEVQSYTRWISIAIYCAVIFIGIRAERDDVLGGFIKFGKAYSTGFKMVMIGSVIGIAMTYLYFGVIDPGYREFLILQQEQELLDRDMSPEQIDAALPQLEKFMTIPMMLMFGLISSLLLGAVITLISAAILKKEDPNEMIG